MPKKISKEEKKQVTLLSIAIVVLVIIVLLLIFAIFYFAPSFNAAPQQPVSAVDHVRSLLTAPPENTPVEISSTTRASLEGNGNAVVPSQNTMNMLSAPE